MADREETKQSPAKGAETKESPSSPSDAAAPANVLAAEEESSASEYEEIIEEVTDYSEAESEVVDDKKQDKNDAKVVVKKEENSLDKEQVTKSSEKSVTVTAKTEVSSTKQETQKTEQVQEITSSKSKTVTETATEIVEEVVEESTTEKDKADDQTDSSEKGESLKLMVHDQKQTPQTMPRPEGSSHSSNHNQSTNSQKPKTSQATNTNSNSKSMQSQKINTTASNTNPVVTIQTSAGRSDSSNSSRQQLSNSNTNLNVHNNDSSSSLGGSSLEVVGNSEDSSSPRQVDRLGVPQKEDSGTESGEDLRLIAAGLRDQLQIQSDSNIIEDVTCALNRLENSLKEGKGISVDTEKRKALLALVARLRAGLTSPEKLAEIAAAMSELDGNEGLYGESSSPEADAHRSNRSRFAKRRNRVNRHTVGVSREELADARRYMEDMLIMGNISQSTTPETNSVPNNAPPQWYPLEKNASSGAILTQTPTPVLQRPKQFVPEEPSVTSYTNRLTLNNAKRRPLSGEYTVTFESPTVHKQSEESQQTAHNTKQSSPPSDSSSKTSRFSNKKHLMKRANTIDLAKSHKYNSEFDSDTDAEDKGPHIGLKRTVQVSVKKRVQNVVPPFEPKTENDRKFLAFINKQSDKPGLGWTTSRSVSNWTNKFGSIKSTFEGGLTSKPPQPPHHGPSKQSSKLFSPPTVHNYNPAPPAPNNYMSNQQIAMRLQQEAERQAEERRRKLERERLEYERREHERMERERLEYERREREKLERQRQQREMLERERLEREHFERQRREQDQIAAAQHAAILREQEKLAAAHHAAQQAAAQQAATAANMNVPQPIPINEFKHAPQSVFRPIDSVDSPVKPIYKPIPQLPRNSSNWQSLQANSPRGQTNNLNVTSPSQYGGNTKPDSSFITSPPPSSRSPIALPWASKPTVDNSSFKSKASRFEERSKYDNINSTGPYIQRHNSLRSANNNGHTIPEDFRKRPSLPNTTDPYSIRQMPVQQDPLSYLPPPQNISFTYSSLKPKATYQSYPCLPSAVVNNESDYPRPREDSLTDPHAVPLVLTSSNPSYCPAPQQAPAPLQHTQQLPPQQLSQPRLPRPLDLASPADSTRTSPSIYTMPQTDCTDDDFDSDNNLLEYHAVSRVMGKPQAQTAVTVGRRTGHVSDDELYGKNSRAAKNLLSTMKSLGNSNGVTKPKAPTMVKRPENMTSPKTCLSPDGRSYQAPIVEPLFPEINKFEPNRQPLFSEEPKLQSTAPLYTQPTTTPRKQLGMYKSMENLRSTGKSYMTTSSQPQSSPKPYVSETQTSYVVTYPIDDTTDDEDFSRASHKKVVPPKTLDLRRQRNISENSTASSTTASMSYSQNLPSPNTSWTSNPIIVDESNSYKNSMPTPYQNPHKSIPSSPAEPSYQAVSSQVVTNYSSGNPNINYNQPPADYLKMASKYEEPSSRQMPVQQQSPIPPYNAATQHPPKQMSQNTMPTTKSSYEAKSQRQLQQQQQIQTSTITPNYHVPTPQATERIQKPTITQKTADYGKQVSTKTTTKTTQEKRTLASMRKTVSEDHHRDREVINPQHSNISQEMLTRLDQQRERISNEMRRKSLGNALDYQMEKQQRFETQNTQEYKSSAPPDTPDIVKSSLPKDENQPILKKFGPPQRHHYMPNAYQTPIANTTTSSVVSSTSTQSTKVKQGKSVHSTSTSKQQQTVQQSTQQIVHHTKPTVMETSSNPQPDDDYIPRNIVFNNVHAFTSMNRRHEEESTAQEEHHNIRPSKLSKSDSWNQILMLQNQQNAHSQAPKFNQTPNNELRRTKSGHTLALPKMYEAAMTKTDISEKQKTVAAYFSGQKSPTQQETVVEQHQTTKRSVINRTKTSEKVSAASRKSLGSNLPIAPGGLQRSATMPHIANLNLLDESNVEDAFEQLIMGS